MLRLKPLHYVLITVAVAIVGGIVVDLLRPRPAPAQVTGNPRERLLKLWKKSGGDINSLSPADRAEAERLRPLGRQLLRAQGVPDLAEEARLLAIWKRRGKKWAKMTAAERERAQNYMMLHRAIPEIQQSAGVH
jgi:hypothetical protein